MKTVPIIFAACMVLSGCATKYVPVTSETLRQSIYATGDALKAHRYELAEGWNGISMRLSPPPEKRIVITNQPLPEDSKNLAVGNANADQELRDKEDNIAALMKENATMKDTISSLRIYQMIVIGLLGAALLGAIGFVAWKLKWIAL